MEPKTPKLGDALIAGGLLVVAIVAATASGGVTLAGQRDYDILGYALIAGQIVPLVWRQRAPRTVVWITFFAWAIAAGLGYRDTPAVFATLIALYGLAAYSPRRTALFNGGAILALMLGWTTVGVLTTDRVQWQAIVTIAVAVTLPLTIGFVDFKRFTRLTELEVQHARREQMARAETAEAVAAERARIARELHDVVAHEMTVMTLQAEGARRAATSLDPAVGEALTTIAQSGRTGLAEMQRMIAVLRSTDPTSTDGRQRELEPMPSLAAIPALVQQVEDAGLPVDLSISGDAHVPAGVELSAYRIIQESLTNALRYAGPGARASVEVVRARGTVALTVEDDGRGAISDVAVASGGHGLVGIRERVESLGGYFDVGPRRGGGFRVHATLPTTDDQIARAVRIAPAAGALGTTGTAL